MSDRIKFMSYRDPNDRATSVIATFEDFLMVNELPIEVVQLIVRGIADRYVEEHFAEVAAKLDQNAIANLALAEASKKIAELIRAGEATDEDMHVEVIIRKGKNDERGTVTEGAEAHPGKPSPPDDGGLG